MADKQKEMCTVYDLFYTDFSIFQSEFRLTEPWLAVLQYRQIWYWHSDVISSSRQVLKKANDLFCILNFLLHMWCRKVKNSCVTEEV